MADIRPFPGIRYNPKKVDNLDKVVTQPYDKVTPKMQDAYLESDPHSFVQLILSKEADPYESSALLCRQWLKDRTLLRDRAAAVYVLHEEFEHGGKKLLRKGFVAAIRVEEFDKGTVLPHELTLSKPKADRLSLLRATQKDYEQIFMLYSDPEAKVDSALAVSDPPDMQAKDEYGVVHKMWVVNDKDKLAAVRENMAGKVLLIADGHHRYETALAYRQEMETQAPVPEDAALRFKTSAFVNIADPGLVILPTHRLIYGLEPLDLSSVFARLRDAFTISPVSDENAAAELARNKDTNTFVLHAGKGKSHLVRLAEAYRIARYFGPDRSADYRTLDVSVLHTVIIEGILGISRSKVEDHVRYERNWDETLKRVDSGENQLAFLLNPTRTDQVQTLAAKGERMPQKSTDFYPKLISGLVFMDVAPDLTL
jgi:uncharacterized protein (DUF1015 family)